MKQLWSERLKQAVRPAFYRAVSRGEMFECPICGYFGTFKDKLVSRRPKVVRKDAKCLGCGAMERHRMLRLVLNEIFADWNPGQKSLLHIAPELCLQQRLRCEFRQYYSADLYAPGVDFKEDIQSLSFADATYDCVLVSRVLTYPPDLEASVREVRRVLKPHGMAIFAETYTHEKTVEHGEFLASRSRQVGMDVLELFRRYFAGVETYVSSRYDRKYQLSNVIRVGGRPKDDYPEAIRLPGVGFMDLVAVCHVG